MISILVPIYNNLVYELATELSSQLLKLNVAGELIFIDDNSNSVFKEKNKQILKLPKVKYEILDENIGRLEIRKLLETKAKFNWLLFLDGDSKIIKQDFLQTYLYHLDKGNDVIIGGRSYLLKKPKDCSLVLHWKYGTTREDIVKRGRGFMTNNFCIKKEIFQSLKFENTWNGYGYEDTWIGMQLEQKKLNLVYINNKVLHNGLETADIFLEKTKLALKNLNMLSKLYSVETLSRHVLLYKFFYFVQKLKLTSIISSTFQLFKKPILKNLSSCSPSLLIFDFYKLNMFIIIYKVEK